MNDTYYFSHESNARNDERMLMFRAEKGWEGYGIYWALLEMMFENEDTCLHFASIKGIALHYGIDKSLLQSVIDTAISEGIFEKDDKSFWSNDLRKGKEIFKKHKDDKSRAGKKGMETRWGDNAKSKEDNNVITDNNSVITNDNKERNKEIKKEREEIKEESPTPFLLFGSYENVKLTESELQTIKREYPDQWKKTLERLSSYLQETGKSFNDYFAVMRRWCKEDSEKVKAAIKPRTLADRELP